MILTCSKCSRRVQIDDAKLPAKSFKVKCPGCGEFIVGEVMAPSSASASAAPNLPSQPQATESISLARPSSLNSEASKKLALLYDPDSESVRKVAEAVQKLFYVPLTVTSIQDVMNKLQTEAFPLVVLCIDEPEAEGLIARINSQKFDYRRHTFLVLISSTLKTARATSSFLWGGNLVINKLDLKKVEYLIAEGVRDFEAFYRTYSEVLAFSNKQSASI